MTLAPGDQVTMQDDMKSGIVGSRGMIGTVEHLNIDGSVVLRFNNQTLTLGSGHKHLLKKVDTDGKPCIHS